MKKDEDMKKDEYKKGYKDYKKDQSKNDNKTEERKDEGNISTSNEHHASEKTDDEDIITQYNEEDRHDNSNDNIIIDDEPVGQDNSIFKNENFFWGRGKHDSKYTSKLSINSLGDINEYNDDYNNYDYYDDDPTNRNKGFLKKNSIILKSLYNLNEDYVNNNINNDAGSTSSHCRNNNSGHNDIPHFKNMRKYNSETNIPCCSKSNKSTNKKLLNRLYNMLFRKKKKYRIKNMDAHSKKKVEKFIENIKFSKENNDDNRKIDEQNIEIQFDTLLDGIFDFLQDYDNSSLNAFNNSTPDDDFVYFSNTTPCGVSLMDFPIYDMENMEADVGGKRNDGDNNDDDDNNDD
ncbi:hypothetical protein PFTANZ_05976, partial [Plasmodium falciparum Tanzania (2000708)]